MIFLVNSSILVNIVAETIICIVEILQPLFFFFLMIFIWVMKKL